jgi:hypothetical protein
VSAQTDQFLPEVDLYYKLPSNLQLWFQAKQTVEAGDPVQAEVGASLNAYLKPWVKLKGAVAFDMDQSKARPLIFSIGYRYLPSPDQASINRLEPLVTVNFPLKGNVLFSDRNRADLDWKNGKLEWRYRNRMNFERTIVINGYRPRPYVSAEFFYERQYQKWSDTALYAGCQLPIGKHLKINPYYEHQNSTGSSPNLVLNQAGLMLELFF